MSDTSPSKSYPPGDISGIVRDIASAKASAARARAAGRPPDAQDTRAVYLDACASIAAAFADQGYKFSKSGAHFTAKSRDKRFTYRVSFQSSMHNIPGQHIKLLVHTSITSPIVKKWESELWAKYGKKYQANGCIEATQLGYLAPLPADRAWIHWELAHENTRQTAIAEVIDRITKHALPWFTHCEDMPRLIETIVETGSYPLRDTFPTELLLCFASKEQTAQALARYISKLHPKGRANLYKDLATAQAESPLEINRSGFFGCSTRYLIAEGITFPDP